MVRVSPGCADGLGDAPMVEKTVAVGTSTTRVDVGCPPMVEKTVAVGTSTTRVDVGCPPMVCRTVAVGTSMVSVEEGLTMGGRVSVLTWPSDSAIVIT